MKTYALYPLAALLALQPAVIPGASAPSSAEPVHAVSARASLVVAPRASAAPAQDADSAAVAGVVGAFHDALSRGDGPAALALLAPDARILEGGGMETVEEYASHHLPADMAFAGAVQRERGPLHVTVRGDVAWAVSTNRVTGTFRDREIDGRGAELVVLARGEEGWRIEAIHWSSR